MVEAKDEKRWEKKGNSSNANNSTLSLHIAAYENSIYAEPEIFDDKNKESINETNSIKKQNNSKRSNIASIFVIQNPFEFPRQQENGGEANSLEVAQYKASQQLLSPNQPIVASGDEATTSQAENNIVEESTVFKWVDNKWVMTKQGSNKKVVEFIYNDVETNIKKELPAVSLELIAGKLNLLFSSNDDTTVNKLVIDKNRRQITIVTSTIYKGPIKQLLSIKNDVSNVTEKNPSAKILTQILLSYKLQSVSDATESPQPTSRKRRHSQQPSASRKSPAIHSYSITQLEKDHISSLKNLLSIDIPTESDTRYLSIDLLQNDFTIRTTFEPNVDAILQDIRKDKWNDEFPLIVNKPNDSNSYHVFKGKTRLSAINKFNAETTDKQQQILTVKCKIYKDLNFDQKLLVNAKNHDTTRPEFAMTIFQQCIR
uniref:ParB/Sulfiredoxin domain-containing protein n=1 Tax=Panagrolaimus davidi TaxID=227884 RepID=A0A914PB51_9BILA